MLSFLFFSLPNAPHLQDELSSFVQKVNPSMRFTDDQMEAILDEVSEAAWEIFRISNGDRHDDRNRRKKNPSA